MSEEQQTVRPSAMNTTKNSRRHRLTLDAVPADMHVLGAIRTQLTQFTHEVGLPEETVADVSLATYEALAHVVEHAYPPGQMGTFDLLAEGRTDDGVLTVAIVDRGAWKPPTDNTRSRRGRGLPLMRACSDDFRITLLRGGTEIRLHRNFEHPVDVGASLVH